MNEGYRDILNSIGSSRPTPGGGSVAALSLAHAHSLATMVSRLTLKSDKWSDGHEIANLIVQQSVDRIDDSISLAERDAAAFDAVMAVEQAHAVNEARMTRHLRLFTQSSQSSNPPGPRGGCPPGPP